MRREKSGFVTHVYNSVILDGGLSEEREGTGGMIS